MKRPKRLSATFVNTVNVPGRYGDGRGGHGLSLLVKSASTGGFSKSWAQRIRLDGKAANVGLGAYPVVTLARARQKALANARIVSEGRDPRDRASRAPTFEQAVETVIGIHAENWKDGGKSAAQWRASLRDYAVPKIGRKRVDRISTADVMEVLLPIWATKRETARRVRQRIGAIMKWAVAQGYREDNPAGDAISAALPKNSVRRQHQRALPHAQVAEALGRVRASKAHRATALAFEFLVLTACRSGEVRGATWAEIQSDVWEIPGERMKAGIEHRVPLSPPALEVLEQTRALNDGSALVFPSPVRHGRTLSDMTLTKVLRDTGLAARATVHGFRSSFRDWCADTGKAREVAEAALAHTVGGVEGAYFRSDLFERRRRLMDAWAAFLTAVEVKIVALHR